MTSIDDVVTANRTYAQQFDHGDAPLPPSKPLVVLTCIDARVHPEEILGLEIGDAHVIRNAGGRASDDAVRSLIISSQLLGTRQCMVIHHTDCGMLTFTNQDVWGKLEAETGVDATDIDFMPFTDVEESARDDVRTIRDNPFLPTDFEVSAWTYDVRSGKIAPIAD